MVDKKLYSIRYKDLSTGDFGEYTGEFYSGKQAKGYFTKISQGIYRIIGVRERR